MAELYLARSETGHRLIGMIKHEIELMHTLKSPKDGDRWARDSHPWFENVLGLLYQEGLSSDATVQYLTAEYAFFTSHDYVEDKGLTIPEAYMHAATAGSPHARLWCAYCMDTGKNGFQKDCEAARKMLDGVEKWPETLTFSELAFMEEEFMELVDEAYDADAREDEIATDPEIPEEDKEGLMPDPTWRSLHLRYVDLAHFMVDLGLPYITREQGYDYRWKSVLTRIPLNEKGDFVAGEKNRWMFWCQDHGIDIELT